MKLNVICPYWGSNHQTASVFLERAKRNGYDGVEIDVPHDNEFTDQLPEYLDKFSLKFIAQQWLASKNETVEEYISRFQENLFRLAEFNPIFINSHTGKDFFSFEENCKVIEKAFEFSAQTGIKVVHETHRGRFAFHSATTANYLDVFPEIQLNADFSHWTNVSESFLEDQAANVEKAIEHTSYIHARVGDTQTAQINTIYSTEWNDAFSVFVKWWIRIYELHKNKGSDEFYICPEFGPKPYMFNPYIKDKFNLRQWEINLLMKKKLLQTFRDD